MEPATEGFEIEKKRVVGDRLLEIALDLREKEVEESTKIDCYIVPRARIMLQYFSGEKVVPRKTIWPP